MPSLLDTSTEICPVGPAGVAEWFPPANKNSGKHPVPMRAATVSQYAPRVASTSQWSPLVYPRREGESIQEIHMRTRRIAHLIEQRCRSMGVTRVLVVSHAATVIAFGRCLLEAEGQETTDWETGDGIEVGAGTASLSVYIKGSEAQKVFASMNSNSSHSSPTSSSPWRQILNGSANHLPGGVEREWTYKDIPGNVEEPGMGLDWQDEEALHEEEMVRLEKAGGEASGRTRANL